MVHVRGRGARARAWCTCAGVASAVRASAWGQCAGVMHVRAIGTCLAWQEADVSDEAAHEETHLAHVGAHREGLRALRARVGAEEWLGERTRRLGVLRARPVITDRWHTKNPSQITLA